MFSCSRVASSTLLRSRANVVTRRWLSTSETAAGAKASASTTSAAKEAAKKVVLEAEPAATKKKDLWNSAEFWGLGGAIAGWGISGSAIYDAYIQGPEVISLTMTPILIVYSTLFARWAWIVNPRNLLLFWCHIANIGAQLNQLRRALEYKIENGQQEQVEEIGRMTAMGGAVLAGAVAGGPMMRSALSGANLGIISTIAAAEAGPFTVHFWAPLSKWFISGASFMDLSRPTDTISLPQYLALTTTGFFFTRYSLLVSPVNYALCSVNIALFTSSGWHLYRKIKADYIDDQQQEPENKTKEE
jgi:hypothetical protein